MELHLRGRVVPDCAVVCAIADVLDAAGVPATHAGSASGPANSAVALADAAAALADAAAAAGALMIDLGPVTADVVASVRERQPGLFVCATGQGAGAADVTQDAAVAAHTGAGLLCGSAHAATASGAGRDSILIAAAPEQVAPLAAAGWAVLVNADDAGSGEAAAVAVAALSAWTGARVVRTRNVAAVRQAIDMVESIRGTRPPARATRGLA